MVLHQFQFANRDIFKMEFKNVNDLPWRSSGKKLKQNAYYVPQGEGKTVIIVNVVALQPIVVTNTQGQHVAVQTNSQWLMTSKFRVYYMHGKPVQNDFPQTFIFIPQNKLNIKTNFMYYTTTSWDSVLYTRSGHSE